MAELVCADSDSMGRLYCTVDDDGEVVLFPPLLAQDMAADPQLLQAVEYFWNYRELSAGYLPIAYCQQ